MARLVERLSFRVIVGVLALGMIVSLASIGALALDSERSDETNQAQDARLSITEADLAVLEVAFERANRRLVQAGEEPVEPPASLAPSGIVPFRPGYDGVDGTDGTDGRDGRDGVGQRGRPGRNGLDGTDGTDGQDGASIEGPPGPQGIPGETVVGPEGPAGPAGESAYPFNFTFTVPGALGDTTYTVACLSGGCTVTAS